MAGHSFHDLPGKPKAMASVLALTLSVMLVEIVGGLWTGSLALLADAGHMATDATAVGLSLFAYWAARKPADPARTFGYHRLEVLAALANGLVLWLLIGGILREAWHRMGSPSEIHGLGMLGVASVGLGSNIVSALLLKHHSEHDLNVRGAYLHVVADALSSVGAMAAALIVLLTGWTYADPLMSVLICILLAFASVGLIRESVHILLEGSPMHLDADEVRAALLKIRGVTDVHDLHLWSLSSGKESMTGHLVIRKGEDSQRVLREGQDVLKSQFGLGHTTLQIETPGAD